MTAKQKNTTESRIGYTALDFDRFINHIGSSFDAPVCDEATKDILRQIIVITDHFSPTRDDSERREFFFSALVPEFTDYAKYCREGFERSEYKEYGLDTKSLKEQYAAEYKGELCKWYCCHIVHIPAKDQRDEPFAAVFLNGVYVLADGDPNAKGYPEDRTRLANAILAAVKVAAGHLMNGDYNDIIERDLPYYMRYGVIRRRDYYDIFPEKRQDLRGDLSDTEVKEITDALHRQQNMPKIMDKFGYRTAPPENAYDAMTARRYFEAAATAIRSIPYKDRKCYRFEETKEEKERYKKLGKSETPREVYCKYADGRDDGLTNLPLDDPDAFAEWMDEKGPYYVMNGHHPWEIRGSMTLSRSIHLFPVNRAGKWFFLLDGPAITTLPETLRYFLALLHAGFPVLLNDADLILDRLEETDNIGICPDIDDRTLTTYVPEIFKKYGNGRPVGDAANLPEKQPERGRVAKEVMWFPERAVWWVE